MHIHQLILTVCLFVCTSCDLITDKPSKIEYTKSDKLNAIISLINIPKNVTEYSVYSYSLNDVKKTLEHGNVTAYLSRKSIILNTVIDRDTNYSVELLKTDKTLCRTIQVFYLIAIDINKRVSDKCLVQNQACRMQVDFEYKCIDLSPVIVKINRPSRYTHLTLQGNERETLYFNENESFSLTCDNKKMTNHSYSLTWTQEFPLAKVFSITQRVLQYTRFTLHLTLRKIDDGTAVYCAGTNKKTSTRFTFKLNKTQTDVKKIPIIKYNGQAPVTYSCAEDQNLLRKTLSGHYTYYTNGSADIYKNDNGSIFFCVIYGKPALIEHFQYYTKRDVYNEVIYIYEDPTSDMKDFDNTVVWLSTVTVAAVIVAGGIALTWCKCCRCRKQQPINSDEQRHVCPTEVMYAEISTLPRRPDRPDPIKEEAPYATIIGVLEQHKRYPDAVSYH